MFRIFIDGNDDRLRLEDRAGNVIGWIRGNTIGFVGLPDEATAILAAVKAWRSLELTLKQAYPGRAPRTVDKSNVRLVHDRAYEWIADGNRPIARLLRPFSDRNLANSYAVEFLTPTYATQHVTISAAQAIWEELAEHSASVSAPVLPPAAVLEGSTSSRPLALAGR